MLRSSNYRLQAQQQWWAMENKLLSEALTHVPAWFWTLVGTLILSNIGAIISLFTFIFKAGKFVANTETGIQDAKEAAVRAHKRIDILEAKEAKP